MNKFNQSPSFRVIPDQGKDAEEVPSTCCGSFCSWLWNNLWVFLLLFLVGSYAVVVCRRPDFSKHTAHHEVVTTADNEGNISAKAPVPPQSCRCPEPCDYSDIINPAKIQKVSDKIVDGRYKEVNPIMDSYLSPLSPTSKSPYKDERVWVQNFNNMQKVFTRDYWDEIKRMLGGIRDKTSELDLTAAEIQRLSDHGHEDGVEGCRKKLREVESTLKAESNEYKNRKLGVEDLDKQRMAEDAKANDLLLQAKNLEPELALKLNGYEVRLRELASFIDSKRRKREQIAEKKRQLAELLELIHTLTFEMKPKSNELGALQDDLRRIQGQMDDLDKQEKVFKDERRSLELRLQIQGAKSNFIGQLKSMVDLNPSTDQHFRELVSKSGTNMAEIEQLIASLNATMSPDTIKVSVSEGSQENQALLQDAYENYARLQEMIKNFRDSQVEISILMKRKGEIDGLRLEIGRKKEDFQAQKDAIAAKIAILNDYLDKNGKLVKKYQGEVDGLRVAIGEKDSDSSAEEREIESIERSRSATKDEYKVG